MRLEIMCISESVPLIFHYIANVLENLTLKPGSRVWMGVANFSCQLKFCLFVSSQLNFGPFVSCQLSVN